MHREPSRTRAGGARPPIAALLLCCLCPAAALGQDRLAGTWQGSWSRAGDTLPVTMVVERDTTIRYTASFGSERLRVSGIPFQSVGVEGTGVSLRLRVSA